jgi:hypothetical protein
VLLVHGREIEENEATEQAGTDVLLVVHGREFLEQQGTYQVTPCLAAPPPLF